jgi:BRCT domain type II-containing protein
VDAAVSLGRKAVDLRQEQFAAGREKDIVHNFKTELAKTLWKRNWSAQKRATEQKAKAAKLSAATTPLDRGSLYEASVTLSSVSDREEARALVQGVIADLEKLPSLDAGQRKDLDKARTVLKGW